MLAEIAAGWHLVDPGAGDVDDHRRYVPKRLAGQDIISGHTSDEPIFDENFTDLMIGACLCSVCARIEHVLEGEALRVLDLRIVVERGAEQSGLCKTRRPPESRGAVEHAMAWERFIARQDVIGHHSRSNQPAPALVTTIDWQEERQRSYEMRRNSQQ